MPLSEITVSSHMSARVFADFSNFNAFQLHHRWIGLAIFPVLMIVLGIVNGATGSQLLFWIFCISGICLPLLYLLFYVVSLHRQIQANHLETPRLIYTVALSKKGLRVQNDKEKTNFRWEQLYRVYIYDHAAYLYITRARAFVLPVSDLPQDCTLQEFTDFVAEYLPSIRLFDKRSAAARKRGEMV